MEIKLAFFSIIAMSLTIIAVGTIVDDWNTSYSSGLTYDLNDYNKLDSMSTVASSQKGNISVKSSSQSDSNFEGTSIRAAFGILNNIYKPFGVVFGNGGMLDSITERFGMPDYIRQGLVTMMIIAITFALITILFGRTKI